MFCLTFFSKVLHLELPGPIHLEETKELIQFSKGNPALCAQVEVGTINNDSSSSSSTSTTTWNSIHFSSNYSPYIIINKNIFHSETNNRYIELSNCKPLSWDHYTEIPITLQNKFHFRARYCIYGYSTMCTEYIKPIKGKIEFESLVFLFLKKITFRIYYGKDILLVKLNIQYWFRVLFDSLSMTIFTSSYMSEKSKLINKLYAFSRIKTR